MGVAGILAAGGLIGWVYGHADWGLLVAALAAARPGDLLYADGHVMMFLGCEDGEAWVIHDTSNTGGLDGRAGQVAGGSKGVLVTPLTPAPAPGGETYFETLYAIKTIQ